MAEIEDPWLPFTRLIQNSALTCLGVALPAPEMFVHSMVFQTIFFPSAHLYSRLTPRATKSSLPLTAASPDAAG